MHFYPSRVGFRGILEYSLALLHTIAHHCNLTRPGWIPAQQLMSGPRKGFGSPEADVCRETLHMA